MTAAPARGGKDGELNVEQLAERIGMTVRTVRFYAARGLVPAPRREGRHGWYGPDHIARLELVRELQAHGFTLAAIERYLEAIPADSTPEDVALHRTLLAPWLPGLPETVDRATLETRAGRSLSDEDVELLLALGVVEPVPDDDESFRLAPAHLAVGVEMLELGVPVDAAAAVQRIYADGARALAEQVTEVFRTLVWPRLRDSGRSPGSIAAVVERYKPLAVQALVVAYENAVDETKRESIRRRT